MGGEAEGIEEGGEGGEEGSPGSLLTHYHTGPHTGEVHSFRLQVVMITWVSCDSILKHENFA